MTVTMKSVVKIVLGLMIVSALYRVYSQAEDPSISAPAGRKPATALTLDHHTNLYRFGIAAREAGMMYIMDPSWYLHVQLPVKEWISKYEAFEKTIATLNTEINKITFQPADTNNKKRLLAHMLSDQEILDELGREVARRIHAFDQSIQPSWHRALKYHQVPSIPGSMTSTPVINKETRDIWVPYTCFSYNKHIRVPLKTTLDAEIADAGSDMSKWLALIGFYHSEAMGVVDLLTRHIQVLTDLEKGKHPATCITHSQWKEIVKVIGVTEPAEQEVLINDILPKIIEFPLVDIQRTDESLVLTVILPILPKTADKVFTLYTVGTVPVPYTEDSWREYDTQPWWLINADQTQMLELNSLDVLDADCISQHDVWYCFEITPLLRIDDRSCWKQIVTSTPPPSLEDCFKDQPLFEPQATEIQANQYLLSAYDPIQMIVTCTGSKKKVTKYELQGLVMFDLPYKCSARTLWFHFIMNWATYT